MLVEKVNDCRISFVKRCQLDAEDFEYGRKMKSGGDHPRGVRPGVGGLAEDGGSGLYSAQ